MKILNLIQNLIIKQKDTITIEESNSWQEVLEFCWSAIKKISSYT